MMRNAITFDTLAFAKKLTAAGFTQQQAEVQAEAIAEIIDENLATKRDLKELEIALSRDIKEMEMQLSIRLGVMMAASIAIVATLIKLL